jgi:Flp pilus assembly protein TadG
MKQTLYDRALRARQKGSAIILAIGVVLITLMISALCIDLGVAYAFQNHMQNAADAAALAAAKTFFTDDSTSAATRRSRARTQASNLVTSNEGYMSLAQDSNQDIQFGFISPSTKKYNPAGFTTPTNDPNYTMYGGHNAVAVSIRRTDTSPAGALPALVSQIIGNKKMMVSATGVAMMDNNISQVRGGLRPFYGCWAQYKAAMADGNPQNDVAQIYGSLRLNGNNVAGCPTYTSGNWGYADLRNGVPNAPGNSTVRRWIEHGYGVPTTPGGSVPSDEQNATTINTDYSVQPGNAISSASSEIDNLICDKTVITIPLVDSLTGSGSNTKARVVGYVGFVITRRVSTGPASGRLVEGYFVNDVCTSRCTTGGGVSPYPGGGLAKLKIVG